MPRGRPRNPIELKILEGTFRPDRDGPLAQQVRAEGSPAPPDRLRGEALAFWHKIAPLVARVAREPDSEALAGMCEWHARYATHAADFDALPAGDRGSLRAGRLLAAASQCWANFDRLASRFGLTPSDRARLRVEAPQSRLPVAPRRRG